MGIGLGGTHHPQPGLCVRLRLDTQRHAWKNRVQGLGIDPNLGAFFAARHFSDLLVWQPRLAQQLAHGRDHLRPLGHRDLASFLLLPSCLDDLGGGPEHGRCAALRSRQSAGCIAHSQLLHGHFAWQQIRADQCGFCGFHFGHHRLWHSQGHWRAIQCLGHRHLQTGHWSAKLFNGCGGRICLAFACRVGFCSRSLGTAPPSGFAQRPLGALGAGTPRVARWGTLVVLRAGGWHAAGGFGYGDLGLLGHALALQPEPDLGQLPV